MPFPIVCRVVDSVRENLEGRALSSLTRVSTAVRAAVEAALTRILTPKRSIDVLREARHLPAAAALRCSRPTRSDALLLARLAPESRIHARKAILLAIQMMCNLLNLAMTR